MIKTNIRRLVKGGAGVLVAVFISVVVFAVPALAQSCDPNTQVQVSIALPGQGNCVSKTDAIFTWLTAIIRFLSAGVGIAVVGGIVYGAIMYTTARENAKQTKQAIIIIINAVIGLLLYILMFAILNFLIPGGILT